MEAGHERETISDQAVRPPALVVPGAYVRKATCRTRGRRTGTWYRRYIPHPCFRCELAGIAGPAPELLETALTRAIDISWQIQVQSKPDDQLPDEVQSETDCQASEDYITEIAISYGLDPEVVKALIEVESGGDPHAVGDSGESLGLMQIQPRWHGERMARLGVTDLFDPYENVLTGCDILAEKLAEYGNLHDALSAYNAGAPCDNGYAERLLNYANSL